jgi:hypothetical protein
LNALANTGKDIKIPVIDNSKDFNEIREHLSRLDSTTSKLQYEKADKKDIDYLMDLIK